MSSKFKKRLKQLHGSRQRRRRAEPAEGQSRVFTADDVEVSDLDVGGSSGGGDPLDGVGDRWRALGAQTCQTPRGPAHYLVRRHRQTYQQGRSRLVEGTAVQLDGLGKKLVDPALHSVSPARLAFVDLETNGLSKTSYPFCIGVGLWEERQFAVYHYLMTSEADEPAALAAFAEAIGEVDGLCTFNGASFDLPMLERRFAQHDIDHPIGELGHLDLLPVARRRLPERKSHKLGLLEEDVLGFERHGDIPGAKIPARWKRYLKTGEPGPLMDVFDHNRLDILTMVVLLAALAPAERRTGQDALPPKQSARRPGQDARPSKQAEPDQPRSKLASRLSRTYALRKKAASANAKTASRPQPAPEPANRPTADEDDDTRDSVKLGGSFSRSKLRRGMPIGSRLRELRSQVERLLADGRADDALAKLHEMVALAPRNPFALENLVAHYQRTNQPALADHFARRLEESSPY